MTVKIRGTQLFIKVGDGQSPETFDHPCLISAKRGIKFSCSANKIVIPDCDNPDDPAWVEVIKDALSASIDGAGKLDVTAVPTYDDWFRNPDPKNVEVWLKDKGHWDGAFQLTGWEVDGDRNDYAEASITLESTGPLGAFVPVA